MLTAAAALVAGVGCSSGSDDAWIEQARAEPVELDDSVLDDDAPAGAMDAGCGALDVDPPPAAVDPDAEQDDRPRARLQRGRRNDPYTATGARQVPGPDMTLAPPPDEPAERVVARPADPDEHVAARNPDGEVTGPVPAPKVIGTAAAGGGTGAPTGDEVQPETGGSCAGLSGL